FSRDWSSDVCSSDLGSERRHASRQQPSGSRNDDVDGLGEDLLADAECGPRVELMLVEVVGLLELEELLGLPAQPVEFGDLGSSRSEERRVGKEWTYV